MDKVLNFTLPQEKLNPAFAGLIKAVNGDPTDKKRGYQLSTANALWGQKDYRSRPISSSCSRTTTAPASTKWTSTAHEAARKTINAWVEKQTNDKIKDLLHEGDLTDLTRLVLTNAIYFKGDWTSQFKKDATKEEPFHLGADKKMDAPMMHQTGKYGCTETASLQALEMPYGKATCRWSCCCPGRWTASPTWRRASTPTSCRLDRQAQKQEVIVTLPKFKTEQRVELADILATMGMDRRSTSEKPTCPAWPASPATCTFPR